MRFLTHSRTFRGLAVILAFMVVSAACSGDDDTEAGPVVLDVLAEAGDEATLELATAQFTEMYPHVSFNITLRAFDDYMQIAPGILSSDDPPDIAHGNQGYTIDGLLVQGGLIQIGRASCRERV